MGGNNSKKEEWWNPPVLVITEYSDIKSPPEDVRYSHVTRRFHYKGVSFEMQNFSNLLKSEVRKKTLEDSTIKIELKPSWESEIVIKEVLFKKGAKEGSIDMEIRLLLNLMLSCKVMS
jgi:hypothetical protein